VHAGYILLTYCYPSDINDVEITDSERADLEYACEVEITNATLYKALGELGDRNSLLPSAYRALKKVELEHLGIFSKLLKRPALTEPVEPLTMQDNWPANIALSHKREEEATKFYQEAAARATTPRIKTVFTSIAEVEADHIAVDEYLQSVAEGTQVAECAQK
jgi:rubrerythrin